MKTLISVLVLFSTSLCFAYQSEGLELKVRDVKADKVMPSAPGSSYAMEEEQGLRNVASDKEETQRDPSSAPKKEGVEPWHYESGDEQEN